MSYSRFSSESDVYIYHHYAGFIECCACFLAEPESEYELIGFAQLNTAREALDHIDQHLAAGHIVPSSCIERIKQEYPDLDAAIEPYVTPPEVRERQLARMRELFKKEE